MGNSKPSVGILHACSDQKLELNTWVISQSFVLASNGRKLALRCASFHLGQTSSLKESSIRDQRPNCWLPELWSLNSYQIWMIVVKCILNIIKLWTEWSLFRMLFNSFSEYLAFCVYQRFNGMQRKRNWFSLCWGTWAKHCVWRSIPWNTTGSMDTVSPYSPHLHPPCSVLYEVTEHEGWELINFTLMYICLN